MSLSMGSASGSSAGSFSQRSSDGPAMDPKLWGTLQHHISLVDNLYLRLPLRAFLQLRGVCKEWNRIASERRCVTDVIRKPYFVCAVQDKSEYFGKYSCCGVMTFHVASGSWRWKYLRTPPYNKKHSFLPFSAEGFVFSVVKELILDLYDAHARRARYIRPFYFLSPGKTFGIAVDASVTPHSFKLIVGSPVEETEIYDSATELWERRSSRMPPLCSEGQRATCKSCLYFEHGVYIWSQVDRILVYSMKEDMWSVLETPPRGEKEVAGGALGAWNGRVFLFMEDGGLSLSLWELVDRFKAQIWKRFARIPSEIHAWLVPPCFQAGNTIRVYASFCQEYVLIHTLLCESGE